MVAAVAAPLFRRCSERMTFGFVLASVLACMTMLVEGAAIAGLLAISEAHAKACAATSVLLGVGGAARATWRWTHFANLLAGQLASLAFAAVRGFEERGPGRGMAGVGHADRLSPLPS